MNYLRNIAVRPVNTSAKNDRGKKHFADPNPVKSTKHILRPA